MARLSVTGFVVISIVMVLQIAGVSESLMTDSPGSINHLNSSENGSDVSSPGSNQSAMTLPSVGAVSNKSNSLNISENISKNQTSSYNIKNSREFSGGPASSETSKSSWPSMRLWMMDSEGDLLSENLSENDSSAEPLDAPALNHRGLVLYRQGNINSSIRFFNESINLSPDWADPHNNMGVALIAQKNYSLALESIDRALQLSGSNPLLWNNKGVALLDRGDLNQATDCFKRSLKLDPKYSPAVNNLGVASEERMRHIEALRYYNASINLDIYNKYAWNNKAKSLAEIGSYQESMNCLKNALILDKNYSTAYVNAAEVYRRVGRSGDSEQALIYARILGYNGTESRFISEPEAVMMKDNILDLPELPVHIPSDTAVSTVFCLLIIRIALAFRHGRLD
ncbi:Photosystem I assembly protein Ycf3 [uncultured archaeon]|nr:Photosystem I assembly protein Ycf3 [uncultured archaeon]